MKYFKNRSFNFTKIIFFLLLLFFNTLLNSQPLPVASYPFNGNPNDVSGNNNHGILAGQTAPPTLTIDRFGNLNSAYEFGGYFNKNWIKIPNNPTLHFDTVLSISLWFKQCAFDGMNGNGQYVTHGYHILISKAGDGWGAVPGIWCGTYTNVNNVMGLDFNNKNGYGNTGNVINFAENSTLNCFDTCEWIHFVVVVKNDSLKMYFNGQLRKNVSITPANFTAANNQDFWIGRMFGSSMIWYPFNGVIDDVNIYNVALNQSDVNLLYGDYYDPLADNNTIIIDSVSIEHPDCFNTHLGSIIVYPNSNNAPYQFSINNGVTFQTSNVFTNLSAGIYTIKIKSNCNEKDTIIPIIQSSVVNINRSISICQGQDYLGYSETGIYIDTLVATNGCDTIVMLNLIVNPEFTFIENHAICNGETYLWHGTNYTTAGTYTATYSTVQGCDSVYTLHLTVNPEYAFTENHTICNGETYLWQGTNYTTTGTYTATYSTVQGCDSVYTLHLTVNPEYAFTENHAICNGETYLWHGTNYTTAGTYTATYSTVQGCDSVYTLDLTVNFLPSVFIGNDTVICSGETLVLDAGANNQSFQWSNGETTQTITIVPLQNTNYSVTVTNSFGCTNSDEITVSVEPIPFIDFLSNPIVGCSPLTVDFSYMGPIGEYLWNFGDGNNSPQENPTHTYNNEGSYSVTLTIQTTLCDYTTEKIDLIRVDPLPEADFYFYPDTCKIQNSNITFYSNSMASNWYWDFRNGNFSTQEPPVSNKYPEKIADYEVTLTIENSFGCRDTIKKTIICNEDILEFPNIFTPNNDGYNDYFLITNAEKYPDNRIQIFNRWGKLVYEKNYYDNTWDGGNLSNGNYYYIFYYMNRSYHSTLIIAR